MAATAEDVAKRAGVSRSTVSYILNGQAHRFSPETRSSVEQAVADLDYRPHAAGRALARGHSDVVLFVLPPAPSAGSFEGINALTDALSELGMPLVMWSPTSSPDALRTVTRSIRPRAVVAGSALGEEQKSILANAGIRILDLAKISSSPGGWNWQIGVMQAKYLVHEAGARSLAYARLEEAHHDVLMDARQAGFVHAAAELRVEAPTVVEVNMHAGSNMTSLDALAAGTGVACYNDHTAAAVVSAARVVGRSVGRGRDFSVIGVDDSPIALQTDPPLTTIAYAVDASMKSLARMLDSDEHGDDDAPIAALRTDSAPRYVIRESA